MNSIWMDTSTKSNFDALVGDASTDVLIVGGGITGILCAYLLRQSGIDCLVAEADVICGGITKNTTAKITLQHGLMYDKMIRRFGGEAASLYLEAQQSAIKKYQELCEDIECDFEVKDSYVYSLKNERCLEREVAALNSLGCPASLNHKLDLPFSVKGAVKVGGQAQFNPLRFAYKLAEDLPVYEHTKIVELLPDGAVTNRGRIRAKKTIIATHFPIDNKHGGYFLKLYQHRSYVLALENAPQINGMYVDENDKGLSFRNYNGLLLLGGGSHRTGKNGGNWRELEDFTRRYYKNSRVMYKWATQDCMSLDRIPYIGQYSHATPNLYVATGYNKWGMTSAMVAATILSDIVVGRHNRYVRVFSPSRSIIRPQLALNCFESIVGLLTPTVPRCPHLGCALKYNPDEHSWDCPCHGSRFTKDGKLIDNPATDDKKL